MPSRKLKKLWTTCQKAVGNKTDNNDGTGLSPVNKTELNTTKTKIRKSMVHIKVEESLGCFLCPQDFT